MINQTIFYKLTSIQFSVTPLNFTDMSVDRNFLCYSVNFTVFLLFKDNFTVYWSFNLSENIVGVKLVKNTYVVVTTVSKIYQIDYQ